MITPEGCISQPPRALGKLIEGIPVFQSFLVPLVSDPENHQFIYYEFLNTPGEKKDSEQEKDLTERQRPAVVIMTGQNDNLRIQRSATNTITWAGSLNVSCEVNREQVKAAAEALVDNPTDDDIEMVWTNFAGMFMAQVASAGNGDAAEDGSVGIYITNTTLRRWGRNPASERSGKGDFHGISFRADWGFGNGV